MRNCCCSLLALLLLLLFLLHLVTSAGSPSFSSFFRFLFNFLFILWDVARNSSEKRVGLLRPGGQGGFYSEEELLARNNYNNSRFNIGGADDEDASSRYEELQSLGDNEDTTQQQLNNSRVKDLTTISNGTRSEYNYDQGEEERAGNS